MSFVSDAAAQGLSFAAAEGVGDAFDAAKALVSDSANRVCCEPGEVRPVPGTGTLAYVLGPPRSDARLRQLNPTRRAPETYENEPRERENGQGTPPEATAAVAGTFNALDPAFALRRISDGRSAFNAFAMPLLGPALAAEIEQADSDSAGEAQDLPARADLPAEWDTYERSFPFDRTARVPLSTAETAAPDFPALASYFDELNHWRRIDDDWLAAAEGFALQADNLTNNTSLVLAFELPAATSGAQRKVLLFVGDAQVGNWLSWDEIPAWQPRGGAVPAQAAADIGDLLRRASFYKVGHHGSHNATLKARGVERMGGDGALTAFVPVSPIVAREIKDWCEMPLDALLDALSQRAAGRVVLANGNVWPPVDDAQLQQARTGIGVEAATTTLPPKVRARDDRQIEGAVPLWVQVAIEY
jgi:hypothetical protein